MDKNKIHIDDFVRKVLADREEDKPVGAWTNMRSLLDKALPVAETVGVATNWRKIMGIASLVVVLSGLGYIAYDKEVFNNLGIATTTDDNENATTNVAVSNTVTPAGGSTSEAFSNSTSNDGATVTNATDANNASIGASSTASGNGGSIAYSTPAVQHVPNRGANTNAAAASTTAKDAKKFVLPAPKAPLALASLEKLNGSLVNTTTVEFGNPVVSSKMPAYYKEKLELIEDIPSLSSAENDPKNVASKNKSNTTSDLSNKASKSNQNTTKSIASTSGIKSGSKGNSNNGQSANNSRSANHGLANHDTLQVIETVAKTRDSRGRPLTKPRIDTISTNKKYVRETPIPANNNDKTLASASSQPIAEATDPVFAASPKARKSFGPMPDDVYAASSENLNASTKTKTTASSKKTNSKETYMNAEGLKNAIDRTKSAISQITFVPGLLCGLNATFGNPNFIGFQMGLTGTFLLSEKWSFSFEPRYMQRANRGAVIKDDYLKTLNLQGGLFSEDTVNHFFNFSTIQSIELPLLLRREVGQFFATIGANLMYAFNINADEVDQARNKPLVSQGTPPTSYTLQTTPSVSYQDFGSRFGIGYTIGLGMQVSPNVQLDLRSTQNIWDNANTPGSKIVSDRLYRAPSFQFTVGYRFVKKSK